MVAHTLEMSKKVNAMGHHIRSDPILAQQTPKPAIAMMMHRQNAFRQEHIELFNCISKFRTRIWGLAICSFVQEEYM